MLLSLFQMEAARFQKHLQFENCSKSWNQPNPDLQTNAITRKRCTGDLYVGDKN